MRSDKKSWEVKCLSNVGSSDEHLWNNVKKFLNWKNSGPPTQLFVNGKLEGSPKRLASIMNDFFIQKVNSLQTRIPPSTDDPL